MTVPYQSTTIQDPGLLKVTPVANVPLILGCCSSGTANSITTLNSPATARSTFGYGPLVEACCAYLTVVGGPVRACRLTQNAAGTMTATLTKSGSGPDITNNSSTPYDWFEVKIKIILGGSLGTATFQYSLDGGRTYNGDNITSAASYTIPNSGVLLTFASGTYVANDVYSGTATGPTYTATEMDTAFTAIKSYELSWDFGCLAGRHATAATANTIFGALDTDRTGLNEPAKYRPWIMDAGGSNVGNTISSFTATSKHINACYGTVDMTSQAPVSGYTTPALPLYVQGVMYAGKELISTSWARTASGQLVGVAGYTTEFGSPLSHDEFINPGLDEKKITTARSWPGAGYYFTRGRVKSPNGSDFTDWHFSRMFSEAHRIVHEAQTQMIGRSWACKSDGTLVEDEAAAAEQKVVKALKTVFHQKNAEGTRGHVSIVGTDPGLFYTIDRTQDVLATDQVVTEWGLRPRGYSYYITTTGGFTAQTVSAT